MVYHGWAMNGRTLGVAFAISDGGFYGLERPFGLGEGNSSSYASRMASAGDRDFRVIPATVSLSSGVYAIFKTE